MLEKRPLNLSFKGINRSETLKMAEKKQIIQREGAKRIGMI